MWSFRLGRLIRIVEVKYIVYPTRVQSTYANANGHKTHISSYSRYVEYKIVKSADLLPAEMFREI